MQFHSIEILQEKLRSFVSEREWSIFHSPKILAIDLNIESSELFELFQWVSDDESYKLDNTKLKDLQDELCDVY